MLQSGMSLQNRYHILSQLGGGGMGAVYLAEDNRLPGRRCAIKEMSPDQLAAQDRNWAIQAFQQEAQMLANLKHPGLTLVTDYFPELGNWYLVMDYIEGETLETHLQRTPGGRLPVDEAQRIARQLCEVLIYLHSQNPPVIFRDLKPGNVMLTPQGDVKLIDFGIARFFKSGKSGDTVNLGTPGYAAPEQYGRMGLQSGPRADVYSLGALLLQMITGYDPTAAQTPFPLPTPRSVMPDISPHIEMVIAQATQVQPDLRYANVRDMQQVLFPPTYPLPPQPAPRARALSSSTESSRPKKWLLLGGGSFATVIGLAICAVVIWTQGWWPGVSPTVAPTVVDEVEAGVMAALPPTATPRATSTPQPTVTPKPTATPRATNTPRATETPSLARLEQAWMATADYRRVNGAAIFAYEVTKLPAIDGDLTEWSGTPYPVPYEVHNPDDKWDGEDDLSGNFHIAWDEDALYLGVEVIDDVHVQAETGRLIYNGDEIELQIDAELHTDFESTDHSSDDVQVGLSPGNFGSLKPEAYVWLPEEMAAPRIEVAARRTGQGYDLEAAIPWYYLGGRPEVEVPIGFCLNLSDKDDPQAEAQEVMASTAPGRKWGDPTTWGTLVLVDWR
ncbi:MAG: protein kinase [Anaerolineae bacterium]|nr:protein kinase [Anaerolineae bacterium]